MEKWFEDARVTTAVTILQREPDRTKRDANPVRFIQLRKPLAEIYSAALDRPLSDEDEATRQSDMDAIRDLIEEVDTDLTTDYLAGPRADTAASLGRRASRPVRRGRRR